MMSEKQVIVTLEDGFGRVQTKINTELSAPQLMEKIMEIDEQQATINELRTQLKQKEQEERLYANEILKLNKEAKEVLDFKSLGGDY